MSNNKKAIILQHGGGELANQLWNFVSVFAFCLEKKFECRNYSFFEYNCNFNIPVKNKLIEFIFFKPFSQRIERRNGFFTKFFRNLYKIYIIIVRIFFKNKIVSSKNTTNEVFYLPPSSTESKYISLLENKSIIYFEGWLFRNPTGLEKYRKEILEYFKPNEKIEKNINKYILELRKRYEHIIGVHIRQGDYKIFKGGKYLIDQKRIREILDEYLSFFQKNSEKICFLITSDGKIEENNFVGLNYIISKKNPVEDLFLLSKTDIVIGSDSSFGEFSAYYGNISHIIFKNEKIDWKYYQKDKYFQNKYCLMTQY